MAVTFVEPAVTPAKPVATLKFSVDYDHVPDRTEVMALMDEAKKTGVPRDAKLSIHRRIVTDVVIP